MRAANPWSVSLLTPATPLGVTLAARVAAGAAEALSLGFGPERRLTAVAMEAARNVVQHAYVDRSPGRIELSIDLVGGSSDSAPEELLASGEVTVRVRDSGGGCPFAPTSSDPPGLGLAMMSELSEALTVRSHKDSGTEIDATISFGGQGLSPPETTTAQAPTGFPSGASALEFGDPSFLASILPRVIAAHSAGPDMTVERVGAVVEQGRHVVRLLSDEPDPPSITIEPGAGSVALRIVVGSLAPERVTGLRDALKRGLPGKGPAVFDSEDGEGCRLALELPLH